MAGVDHLGQRRQGTGQLQQPTGGISRTLRLETNGEVFGSIGALAAPIVQTFHTDDSGLNNIVQVL